VMKALPVNRFHAKLFYVLHEIKYYHLSSDVSMIFIYCGLLDDNVFPLNSICQ
jgi:hypothetical protein